MQIHDMTYLDAKGYENSMSFKAYIEWIAENSRELLNYEFESKEDLMKFFKNEEYRKHKAELSAVFTLNEAIAVISLFQIYPSLTPVRNHKDILIWEVEDGIKYNFLLERFDIDEDRMLEKLKKLTEEQSATAIIMAIEVWISTCETTCVGNDVIKEIFMVN